MTEMIRTVGIFGAKAPALLTACLIARFAPIEPSKVSVTFTDERSTPERYVIREDLTRLHKAIGLDLSQITRAGDAAPISEWTSDDQTVSVGFGGLGRPLHEIPFVSAWARGRSQGETPPLISFTQQAFDGHQIKTASYANALEQIALRAGVQIGTAAMSADLHITLEPLNAPEIYTSDYNWIALGSAAIPTSLREALELHIVQKTVMALVTSWPNGLEDATARGEVQRKVDALKPCLEQMQELLIEHGQSPNRSNELQHRIDLWQACGRICPQDHDPFSSAEWMSALLAAGYEPKGYSRQANRVSEERLKQHLHDNVAGSAASV